MEKIILLDNTNFIDYPVGGTLSFDKQLVSCLSPDQVSLVGITTNRLLKIGEWTKIVIEDKTYDFFPLMYLSPQNKKPIIPLRLQSLFFLFIRMKKIKMNYKMIFTQTPQFLFVLRLQKWEVLCFCFAGLGNSVKLSRYKALRWFGDIYENALISVLQKHVDIILAAADQKAISEFIIKSKGRLNKKEIKSFPTRFNNNVFKHQDSVECKSMLKLPLNKKIIVVVGRLSWVKGWDLAIEIMRLPELDNSILIFVGDGECRKDIEKKANTLITSGKIIMTGMLSPNEVSKYINAADVSLIVSHKEGWSTTIVESIACGKPVVSTDISSARDLIKEGENGFILSNRDPHKLSILVNQAFSLNNAKNVSLAIAKNYSIETLKSDFLSKFNKS